MAENTVTTTSKKEKMHKPEPLFRIAKKDNTGFFGKTVIRGIAFLASLLVILIVLNIITKDSFAVSMDYIIKGAFGEGSAKQTTLNTMFNSMMMLLVIALGLAPAFKMKFWNIGAQGQALIGNLMASMMVYYLGGKVNDGAVLFLAFVLAVIGGGIWALIPAIAKVKLKANETLFTLMMNYIAIQLVFCFIDFWKGNSQSLPPFENGHFNFVGGNVYGLTYILVSLLTIGMFIYMAKTKHGYELTVVGESINTARYAGINTSKVILRTAFLSGALCAFAGFLYTGNVHHLSTLSDNGYGFTAIIVAWGAHFNPFAMAVLSFIIAVLQRGCTSIQGAHSTIINNYLSYIVVGIFLFFLIGCEFFVNYKFVWHAKIIAKCKALNSKLHEKMPKTCQFFAKVKAFFKNCGVKTGEFLALIKSKFNAIFAKIGDAISQMFEKITYKLAKRSVKNKTAASEGDKEEIDG